MPDKIRKNSPFHLRHYSIIFLLMFIGMAEFLPVRLTLVLLLSCFMAGAALWALDRRWIPALWLLLPVFYFFPYENINPLVRETGEYFNVYSRIFGPMSVWDVVLVLAMALIGVQKMKKGKFVLRGIPVGPWLLILLFYLFAFFMGFLHVKGNLLSYGNTDVLRPFVASQVILYMFLVYWITANSLESGADVVATVRLLKTLSVLLILYGLVRGVLILQGILPTIWPFGLPIILYNQMIMLYLVVFWGWIYYMHKDQPVAISGLWLSLALILILTSTRRFNYFVLVAGSLAAIVVATHFYRLSAKGAWLTLRKPLMGFVVVVFLILLIFPNWIESVLYSFQSINIYRVNDTITNNDIRRFAMSNMFLNLFERPYTLLTGFGLGTTWKAIIYQPFDTLFLSVNAKFLERSLGWYPQFPLPYLNAIYRYGVIGTLVYWTLCGALLVGYYKKLVKFRDQYFPFAFYLGSLILIPFFLGLIGDIYNPTGPVLAGILIALIERTLALQEAGEIRWQD